MTDGENGHVWHDRVFSSMKIKCCMNCGFIKNEDQMNKPCPGPIGAGLRERQEPTMTDTPVPEDVRKLAQLFATKTAMAEPAEVVENFIVAILADREKRGEPVAWQGVNESGWLDLTDDRSVADQWVADGIPIIPLYAAPPAPAQPVAIKPLEWVKSKNSDVGHWHADTSAFECYEVWAELDGKSRWYAPYMNAGVTVENLEAAKAAAQADYEARIRSALLDPVKPVDVDAAYERAAKVAESKMYDFGCSACDDAADFMTLCAELAAAIRSLKGGV